MRLPPGIDYRGASKRLLVPALVVGVTTLAVTPVALTGRGDPFEFALLRPSVGLVVALGVVYGPIGALGAGLGALAATLLAGSASPLDLFTAAALFWMGSLSFYLLRGRDPGWRGIASWFHPVRSVVPFASVSLVAAAAGASTVAWGYEFEGTAAFYVAPRLALSYVTSALIVGLPLLYLLQYVGGWLPGLPPSRGPTRASTSSIKAMVITPLAWLSLGSVWSAGYRAFARLHTTNPHALEERGLAFVAVLYNDLLFGPGGRYVQIVLGSIMVAVLVVASLSEIDVAGKTLKPHDRMDEA